MKFSINLLLFLTFLLTSENAFAAAMEWFFSPFFGSDEYQVRTVIYGDDQRGLAGYEIHLSDLDDLGVDPNSISWSPNSHWAAVPETTIGANFFTVANQQLVELSSPIFDLGTPRSIDLGVLTIPGAMGTFFSSRNFRQTTAEVFSSSAPAAPPATPMEALTLTNNQLSSSHHGGNIHADYIIRTIPDFGDTVDFGVVDGAMTLENIVGLVNHGFGGEFLNVTGMQVTGTDAGAFSVPGFAPTVLQAGQPATTYDVAFSPDRPGIFQAELKFVYEDSFFGDQFVLFPLLGAVTSPGDIDGNGIVAADDLNHPTTGWQARFGVDLDGSHLLHWQRDLNVGGVGVGGGRSLKSVVHVPEPEAGILLAAVTLLMVSRRDVAI